MAEAVAGLVPSLATDGGVTGWARRVAKVVSPGRRRPTRMVWMKRASASEAARPCRRASTVRVDGFWRVTAGRTSSVCVSRPLSYRLVTNGVPVCWRISVVVAMPRVMAEVAGVPARTLNRRRITAVGVVRREGVAVRTRRTCTVPGVATATALLPGVAAVPLARAKSVPLAGEVAKLICAGS